MTGNSNSGAPRKATARRNGRVYVALDMVSSVIVDNSSGTMIRHYRKLGKWFVDGIPFADFDAAAAEFERRVNAAE